MKRILISLCSLSMLTSCMTFNITTINTHGHAEDVLDHDQKKENSATIDIPLT